jgi:hypothetical protein
MVRFQSAILVGAMLGAAATVGAQAPSDRPQTISGCMERAANGTYVMTKIDLPSGTARPASGTSGAVATTGSGDSKLPVIGLIPPSVSLRNFIDQRVEVVGVVRDSPSQPGTQAVEIVDLSRLPANTPPVKKIADSCK